MREKKVLIQCGDHYENQSRVFLLAKTIKKMGHTPVILMYSVGKGNLFKINNIQVVYINQFLRKIENKNIDFTTVIYNDLQIKPFIEVEIKRNPRLGWPSQVRRTANMAVRYINALNALIDTIKPDHIVVWNGFTGYVANVLRVLSDNRGIANSFIERGLLKESLFLDSKGVNGGSSIAEKLPKFSECLENADSQYIHNRLIKEPIKGIKKPPKMRGKKVVFFPLQVQLDTNIILYCPYNTMREVFLQKIYRTFNSDDTVFVVRPHPEEAADTKPNIPNFDNVIVSSEETLDYWLNLADLVVTINSTVGLEALILNKSVICLGESIYSPMKSVMNTPVWKSVDKTQKDDVNNYLFFLLKNNLIVNDNDYNEEVVSKQLLLEKRVNKGEKPQRKALLEIKEPSKLGVYCDFSFAAKLNLTYRDHSLPISHQWIEQIMKNNFPSCSFTVTEDKRAAEVIIVDEVCDTKNISSDKLILDIYGHRLR